MFTFCVCVGHGVDLCVVQTGTRTSVCVCACVCALHTLLMGAPQSLSRGNEKVKVSTCHIRQRCKPNIHAHSRGVPLDTAIHSCALI